MCVQLRIVWLLWVFLGLVFGFSIFFFLLFSDWNNPTLLSYIVRIKQKMAESSLTAHEWSVVQDTRKAKAAHEGRWPLFSVSARNVGAQRNVVVAWRNLPFNSIRLLFFFLVLPFWDLHISLLLLCFFLFFRVSTYFWPFFQFLLVSDFWKNLKRKSRDVAMPLSYAHDAFFLQTLSHFTFNV